MWHTLPFTRWKLNPVILLMHVSRRCAPAKNKKMVLKGILIHEHSGISVTVISRIYP